MGTGRPDCDRGALEPATPLDHSVMAGADASPSTEPNAPHIGPKPAHGSFFGMLRAAQARAVRWLLWGSLASPRLFAQATERDEAARRPVRASRYAGLSAAALATLACMGVTHYERATEPGLDTLGSFFASFLLLFRLTGYVIGFDRPAPEGARAKLVDVFELVPGACTECART